MAEATEKDLVYDSGDDETFTITFDCDITGWTIYFDLNNLSGTPAISKTITEHSDAENGVTGFTLTDTETSVLDGIYRYEMRYESDTGTDETFLKGKMEFV